ncbi:phosphoenolpyruvate carboxylase [Myxococcota bacterium]|nr:phosphoenolpyruvate carboxylase [Myxococcota bacterium]
MGRTRAVDEPLRRDVRHLGRVLGDVLVALEGGEVFELEERVRRLAIERRRGPRGRREAAAAELSELLASLPLTTEVPVIRAFATYFQLVNVAEQHHRVRRARAHAGDPEPQRGSLLSVLRDARDAGRTAEQVRAAFQGLEITLTLTAHPTQALRRTVLDKLDRISSHLEEADRCALTPREREASHREVREEVTALWLTDEVRHERPTVGDEVKNVLWYAEGVLWDRIPELTRAFDDAFRRVYDEPLGVTRTPLRVHSWVGGDMDGHPGVTPEVFEDALHAYRARGLRRLLREVEALGGALSASSRAVPSPPALAASLGADSLSMPEVAARIDLRTEGEPWRRKLRFVEARLAASAARSEAHRAAPGEGPAPGATHGEPSGRGALPYRAAGELAADLDLVADTLLAAAGPDSGERLARDLSERVRALGMGSAELEIRVPAEDARDGASALRRDTEPGPGGARLLASLRRLASAQAEGGEEICRTLILSMARDADDVLAALACARACGAWDEARGCARLDVVPLFEQLQDLDGSPIVVRALFADPGYRRHVHARGVQEVMLGYSDSGKQVGLLAASGALRRTQAALAEICRAEGLPLRVFHGRGESVARGGGPAQQAILSLPAGSVAGRYKATEQGEALDHRYARPALAMRTLELLVGGALLHTLGAEPRPDPAREAAYAGAFDALAEAGRDAYRALVWEEPRFVDFFEAATPIDEIARLPIGSRPSRRRAGGVDALRAIPWVFAWTQTRAILPGWYGVGSALDSFSGRGGGPDLLREMYGAWPFFRAVIDNVEMVLAKTDLPIAARYADLAPPDARRAVWPRIVKEHARTRRAVLRVKGTRRLLADNPTLARSIALRNPYVDPMNFLQVELLRRRREGQPGCDRPLLLTLGGIAAGMRNTG